MARTVLIRLALLAACLLVFVPTGHIALPMGIAFLRFVNPQYAAEPVDWVILSLLGTGIGLSMLSCRWAPRWLLALSIAAYVGVIVLVYRAWADPMDLVFLATGVPFVMVSVWSLLRVRPRTSSKA